MKIPATYTHNNGDKVPIVVNGFDGKGRAFVTWENGFKNLIPISRIEYLPDEPESDFITWRDVP